MPTTPQMPTTKKRREWSMDMSYEAAQIWGDRANIMLVVSLLVGLIATYMVISTGNVKEEHVKAKLAESHERAAHLEKDAALSKERTTQLEKEVAVQRERAAVAERDLLQIKERIQPRQIGAGAVAMLRAARSQATIELSAMAGPEGEQLAESIRTALVAAGWTVHQFGLSAMQPFTGIIVVQRSQGKPDPGTAALAAVLNGAGIKFDAVFNPELPAGTVVIRIGGKP
jgi:hypothetical protein